MSRVLILRKLPVLSWQKCDWEGKTLFSCIVLFVQQWERWEALMELE